MPPDYGCAIVVGPALAVAIGGRFVICELDWVKVKGKVEAFSVFQLIGERSTAESAQMRYREQYGAGLERYRAGDFATAEDIWRQQATGSIGGLPLPPRR